MSSGRPRHRGGRHGNTGGERRPEPTEPSADDTPTVSMFRGFAAKLDRKHDTHERLVKMSRDVTIESKRIIFMLHRVTSVEKDQHVLVEAAERFSQLENGALRQIAEELESQELYLYLKAISPGLQEYIEALSFYHYLLQDRVISCAEVQQRLTYARRPAGAGAAADAPGDAPADPGQPSEPPPATDAPQPPTDVEPPPPPPADADTPVKQPPPTADAGGTEGQVCLPLPYHEYVLGLADLTGELMRRCISSVSSGQMDECWRLCAVLRAMHEGFLNIGNTGPREIGRKMHTLRQSVSKVENACYQLKVRGEEIPKHMLADVFSGGDDLAAREEYVAD